jgi:3-dehydroquinate synthase
MFCLPLLEKKFPALSRVPRLAIKPGEASKDIHTLNLVWEWLAAKGAGRDAVLINLGGGVISDIGGFAAGTYHRGIRYINIPTSLIGQVDAAIGGKTGINVDSLKNQAGLFYDPEGVIIDPVFLSTLPERHLRSGVAEIIKSAALSGGEIWERICFVKITDDQQWKSHILPTAHIKCSIVAADPFEKGQRKVLNFGHTFGHALETLSMRDGSKTLLHGEAVAAGMILEGVLSNRILNFPDQQLDRLTSLILHYFQPAPVLPDKAEDLLGLITKDKKSFGGIPGFSLLEETGKPVYDIVCGEAALREAISIFNSLVK